MDARGKFPVEEQDPRQRIRRVQPPFAELPPERRPAEDREGAGAREAGDFVAQDPRPPRLRRQRRLPPSGRPREEEGARAEPERRRVDQHPSAVEEEAGQQDAQVAVEGRRPVDGPDGSPARRGVERPVEVVPPDAPASAGEAVELRLHVRPRRMAPVGRHRQPDRGGAAGVEAPVPAGRPLRQGSPPAGEGEGNAAEIDAKRRVRHGSRQILDAAGTSAGKTTNVQPTTTNKRSTPNIQHNPVRLVVGG